MSVIEKSWYKKPSLLTVLLLPLSVIFWLISTLRKYLYKINILKAFKAHVPVIVVGNISVGGNGKTPFVIWLAQYLQQQGLKVAVISRGYGGKSASYPLLVTDDTATSEAGDEPVLIKRRLGCVVMVGPDRQASMGPVAIKAIRTILPAGTRLFPVGGISPATMEPFKPAGVAGFGLGSALYKPGDSAATVAAQARDFVAAWADFAG